MKILVSGMLAGHPHQGGATWAVLQFVLGLQQLGHEVYVVESLKDTCLGADEPLDASKQARYFRAVMARFGLTGHGAMVRYATRESIGLSYEQFTDTARRTDVLLNISGTLKMDEPMSSIPIRAYLDLDPGFAQFWHTQGINVGFAGHTHFVTVAQTIGDGGSTVVNCGLNWITTFQPVVLSEWPVANKIVWNGLTTVGNWRAYGSIEHNGIFYGQKAHSVRRFIHLPARLNVPVILAMGIHQDEREDLCALHENGWQIIDPLQVAGAPDEYRDFIQHSWAELGIAKHGYVTSRCGWFSDRSACYLASGRPVIAQDTGFSRFLPTGKGLFAFNDTADIIEITRYISSDYEGNARTARNIAETYFDSAKVLTRLLNAVTGAD